VLNNVKAIGAKYLTELEALRERYNQDVLLFAQLLDDKVRAAAAKSILSQIDDGTMLPLLAKTKKFREKCSVHCARKTILSKVLECASILQR